VQDALAFFLAYYTTTCRSHGTLSRLRETLTGWLRPGKMVLTNKPVRMSRLIVEALGVEGHFQRVIRREQLRTEETASDPGLRLS